MEPPATILCTETVGGVGAAAVAVMVVTLFASRLLIRAVDDVPPPPPPPDDDVGVLAPLDEVAANVIGTAVEDVEAVLVATVATLPVVDFTNVGVLT